LEHEFKPISNIGPPPQTKQWRFLGWPWLSFATGDITEGQGLLQLQIALNLVI